MIHFVETFFDIDRPTYRTTEEWVRFRHAFFLDYTLPALLNQGFDGFRIIVHCGSRNAAITRELHWPPRVDMVYGFGRQIYERFPGDIAITRIDSDDLLRYDAMRTVAAAVAANPGAKAFAFKQNLCWDMVNGIIFDHVRPSTPFVTTVWTRRELQDWAAFSAAHFRAHGGDGLGDRGALELPRRMVLVTKHGQNTNLLKRGKTHPVFTEAEKLKLKAYNDDGKVWKLGWKTTDPIEIAAITARFGVRARGTP